MTQNNNGCLQALLIAIIVLLAVIVSLLIVWS